MRKYINALAAMLVATTLMLALQGCGGGDKQAADEQVVVTVDSVGETRYDQYQVTASSLNVRQRPDKHGDKVGELRRGEIVELRSQSGAWAEVSNGTIDGYVFSKYLAPYMKADDPNYQPVGTVASPASESDEKVSDWPDWLTKGLFGIGPWWTLGIFALLFGIGMVLDNLWLKLVLVLPLGLVGIGVGLYIAYWVDIIFRYIDWVNPLTWFLNDLVWTMFRGTVSFWSIVVAILMDWTSLLMFCLLLWGAYLCVFKALQLEWPQWVVFVLVSGIVLYLGCGVHSDIAGPSGMIDPSSKWVLNACNVGVAIFALILPLDD